MKARVIAMYLPQYHPIPENDIHWGPGFTEWRNVVQAKPLFRGHYQPHLPADLGFYDLRVPEVRQVQADMAREAGIEGFMYWHYWFGNGRMLLEKPFQEVLKTGKPDFPFCLGWANHSWTTKTWVKGKNFAKDTMIMEQLYPGEEDYRAHFDYVLPAFKDKRYITVDGKPLFLIWNAYDIPDCKSFMNLWRKWANEEGLPGIYFVGLRNGYKRYLQPLLDMGFDGVNERGIWEAEEKSLGWLLRRFRSTFSMRLKMVANKYNYSKIIKYLNNDDCYLENVFPTILPGYDRSPRSGKKGPIYHNATPKNFDRLVKDTLKFVENKEDEHKIIFLMSWNEWGEGNHMEPDIKYGHQFLDVLKNNL